METEGILPNSLPPSLAIPRGYRVRRIIFFAMLIMLMLVNGSEAETPDERQGISRAEAAAMLARVRSWACQYQNVDPVRIANSALDLVVIDPMLDGGTKRAAGPHDMRLMQRKPDGGRRLVIAYLSVGAAAEYLPYWKAEWRASPPEWLGGEDPNWPRSYPVRFWHSQWQEILMGEDSPIPNIVHAGFDGIFLDRVDAFWDWRNHHPSASDDMADLVVKLVTRAREFRPNFLVIGQNAEPLLTLERYRKAIDAVSKESLLYGLQGEGERNRPEQIGWSLHYLNAAKRAGLPILAIEYLHAPSEIASARRRLNDLGFVPFFATRLLDRL
jgi:cysteinyl-tRNA synthetase